MTPASTLDRLLAAAAQADDPARRVAEALADDPEFARWAGEFGRIGVVSHGDLGDAMADGVTWVAGTGVGVARGTGDGDATVPARRLVLLSPGADDGCLDELPPVAETLALVVGDLSPALEGALVRDGTVIRRLGELRSVVAAVTGAARTEGLVSVVLATALRGQADAAGRGLARAAQAARLGIGVPSLPACLVLSGPLVADVADAVDSDALPWPSGGDPAEALRRAALAVLAGDPAAAGAIAIDAVLLGTRGTGGVLAIAIVR